MTDTRQVEAALIGAVVYDSALADDMFSIVKPRDFQVYGALAQILEKMYADGEAIDYLTVRARLDGKANALDAALDAYNAMQVGATPLLVRQWAATLAASAKRARLKQALVRAAQLIDTENDITRAQRAVAEILSPAIEDSQTSLRELAEIATDHVADFTMRLDNPSTSWGLPTGFKRLDDVLGGLQNGGLYVIAARPSVGKTAFALGMAYNIAARGERVAFFSLEMTAKQLLTRLVCIAGGFNSHAIKSGMIDGALWSDELRDRLFRCYDDVSRLPLYIDETPALTTADMQIRLRQLWRTAPPSVVFVDYINLMRGVGENRYAELSCVVRGLKNLAREFNIPVVALAQLSRKTEATDAREPSLSHLRDTGAIEEVAQVVILLYRQDYVERQNPGWVPNHKSKVIIAKNQDGAIGFVEMRFDEQTARFYD